MRQAPARFVHAVVCTAGIVLASGRATAAPPVMPCAELARRALPGATMVTAERIAEGAYTLAAGRPEPPGMDLAGRVLQPHNPAFCRIAFTLMPSPDSHIRTEVWLPSAGWNGKFLGVGNFGWGGELRPDGMLTGLQDGYAVGSNDTGHSGAGPDGHGGRFSLGHPERLIDYAYRANHVMTEAAKTLINRFYGLPATRSYWIGCSLGGLQGLIEAKRYPTDYDGIVAGAPPNPLVHFNAAQLWPGWLVAQDPRRLIPQAKYTLIHDAVLKTCADAQGIKDGVLDHPQTCSFDPAQLQCKGAEMLNCLTAPQVTLMREIYDGPKDPRTGRVIFPGPARGSELELGIFANGKPFLNALDLFRYAAFQDPAWTVSEMDWHDSIAAADTRLAPLMRVDSSLKPFFDHGGRLLLYIGWNDYHNPAELESYARALSAPLGDKAHHHVRLFLIPGMGHCAGGQGCDTFDKLGAIDAWVDRKQPPERLVAARLEAGRVVRTRPLCAYPATAQYDGHGDAADAASFSCRTAH